MIDEKALIADVLEYAGSRDAPPWLRAAFATAGIAVVAAVLTLCLLDQIGVLDEVARRQR